MTVYDRVVAYEMVDRPAVPAPTEMAVPRPLGDCRHCGYPAFGTDEVGPVHLCCVRAEAAGHKCDACVQSRQAALRQAPGPRR